MDHAKRSEELITEPIPKLIRRIAVPASVGFFFHTMYNVVDTYFGGLISTEALAALSLSFPVFFVIIALSSGVGVGTNVLISNSLGAGDTETAKKCAAQSLSFALIVSILATTLGLIFAPFLFKILGAEGEYLNIALSYINIIFIGSIFFVFSNLFNGILNSVGETRPYRNFLIFGFFLNLILDPWFMFGGLGLPPMGLAGVAWATVVIQLIGVLYLFPKVLKTKLIGRETLQVIKPEKKPLFELAHQGFPASLNMMTVAIGIFVITFFISKFGKPAVAAYGIATRIEQIALLPTIGLNIATLTLVGQNNGAKKLERVKEAIKTSLSYGLLIMTLGAVGVLFFTRPLMNLFTNDTAVINIGVQYLKIAAFIFWAYAVLFITNSGLRGMKKPFFPLLIGLGRQIVAPLAIFSLMIYVFNPNLLNIWWGIFTINWLGAGVAFWYLYYAIKKIGVTSPRI